VSVAQILRLVAYGPLARVKAGDQWKVKRADVLALMEADEQ
jgi:hypothetical protein